MFVAGDDEGDVFGTVSGHLDFLSRFSASDGHVAHVTHPGFWFGFAPLLTGTPRRFTVIARTDALLAVVRAKQLQGLLKKHPEWWRHLGVGITEYADIAANALGTILRSLQDAEFISIGYGKIRPLQPEKLRTLVEAG